MTKTLFQISEEARALETLLDEIEGDISDPEVAETIDNWLREYSNDLSAKADGYAALIKELEARSNARKAEASRMSELARTDDNKAKRLKERLKNFMEETGTLKIETARYRLSVAGNGGVLPLILKDDIDLNLVPESFTKRVLDEKAVRAALDNNEPVLFAQFGERGTSLRIK